LQAGLVIDPWQYRWSSSPAYALGEPNELLSYNVWYQSLGADAKERQQRWREFLLAEDPHEEVVRSANWVIGDDDYRRRLQRTEARPARRCGRPRKPPPGQEGYFPEFYLDNEDA
jgi:hypothetical protein